jgi:hypothetical protein
VCRLLTSYVAAHKVRGVCEGALGGESTSPLPGSAIVSIFLQIHSNLKILHIHSNLAIIDLVVAVTRAAAAGRLLYAAARARRLLRSRARGGAAAAAAAAARRAAAAAAAASHRASSYICYIDHRPRQAGIISLAPWPRGTIGWERAEPRHSTGLEAKLS